MTNEKTKDTALDMHLCEVESVCRMFREKGPEHVRGFLLKVEKHRGSEAADRLRQAALKTLGYKK